MRIKGALLKKIGILICLCLMCCSFKVDSVFYAKEKTVFAEERHRSKINDTLVYLGYDEADEIYSTEYISVADNCEKRIVFLYKENEMIGEYIVNDTGEDIYECFIIDNSETLYDLVASNERIEIVDDQYGMRVENDNKSYTISRRRDLQSDSEMPAKYSRLDSNVVEVEETDEVCDSIILAPDNHKYTSISSNSAVYLLSVAKSGVVLTVDNVANDRNPRTRAGLCWSASGASIVNYMKGTSYSALSMWEYVTEQMGSNAYGIPTYEKAMFDLQGLQYTYLEGKVHYYGVIDH